MFRRPCWLIPAALLLALLGRPGAAAAQTESLTVSGSGHTAHGDWSAELRLYRPTWQPGQGLRYDITLTLADSHLSRLAAAGVKADRLCVLVTAERTFDADGWLRLASDEKMSTLLTPTGLAIEGGIQGAVTSRYGYAFKAPVDQLTAVPLSTLASGPVAGTVVATFSDFVTLPASLPPGFYRLRLDFGAMVGTKAYNINGFSFAVRPFSSEAGTATYFYTPLIPASGTHVSGRTVDAETIQPRIPWLLLANYASNGYRGVVAEEDRHRFAISDRNLIPDEVILPRYDASGNKLAYSLEPTFPADTIDALQNLAWRWTEGAISVRVTGPDGSVIDLGTHPIVAKSGNGPTTKVSALTAWRPSQYGRHTVTTTGWIADGSGRRVDGGGTYRFWIAKRMTLATATFQGQPYLVGSSYGRDIQFNPAVPAAVTVTAGLYPNSDATAVRSLTYAGTASPAGLYGAAQGMKPFPLNVPGEYHAKILATYTDPDGHLWVSTMRHAGIVYPAASKVTARGKKLLIGNQYLDRGETRFEGHVHDNGDQHLAHVTFPYLAGDMLLIGAEGQGANKIEPVLTYQMAGDTSPWDTRLNGVGTTNLSIKTSNGYSPHLYPEYITDIEYYYGAAPRPGFMGRFIVGESTVRAPYWPVSPNSFGGQIGASPNGDLPGDIYRLIGGVVLRRAGQDPMYSGYMANAFLLPKGTNNNRVSAPGTEDLTGSTGIPGRFFLVGLRPGTAFEQGSTFRPALQIDPMLPVAITFTLHYPDGRTQVATGTGDASGSFAGPTNWSLDVPGVYRYQVKGRWNGYEGTMPGLPDNGGYFFVYTRIRPADATGLTIDGAPQRTVSPSARTTITGRVSASKVYYTILTPGAVIDQGELPVTGGTFSYAFDPAAIHARVPIYDIVSITTGQPQIGRVIHLTFFAEERTASGASFHTISRVILRGTTMLSARSAVSATVLTLPPPVLTATTDLADARDAVTLTAGLNTIVAADTLASRAWDDRLDYLLRRGELERVAVVTDPALPGRVHERLRQVVHGVPLEGADVVRQLSGGTTVSIFGRLYAGVAVDTSPTVSASSAVDAAVASQRVDATVVAEPRLCIVHSASGDDVLTWRLSLALRNDVRRIDVDARTGSVLRAVSLLRPLEAGGRLLSDPAHEALPRLRAGAIAAVSSRRHGLTIDTYDVRPAPDASAAAQRHADIESALDVLAARLGGNPPVDPDKPLVVIIHGGSTSAWDGSTIYLQGSLGTSDGRDAAAAGVASRAVVDSAALSAEDEVGQLADGLGRLLGLATRATSEIFRTATSPADTDAVTLAYTLAVRGGRHPRTGEPVVGVGPEHRTDVERAIVRAWMYMLTPGATADDARAACLQSARDLFGDASPVERALSRAWPASTDVHR